MAKEAVQVLAERCSGSNYLQALLWLNYGIESTTPWVHKHEFLNSTFSPTVPLVLMVRDPYDWLDSFAANPHHAPTLRNVAFEAFLREPFISYFDDPRAGLYWNRDGWERLVREDNVQESFSSVLELRVMKLRKMRELAQREHSVILRYEDLAGDPSLIRMVERWSHRARFTCIRDTHFYKGNPAYGAYVKRTSRRFLVSELAEIAAGLDWECERSFGYARRTT